METYWGKCPGYYFKKCVLERTQVKTRINYELETQTIVNRRCCEGYAEIKGSCVPHCALGCVFGNCTGPNECTCYEGYVMEKQNKLVSFYSGLEIVFKISNVSDAFHIVKDAHMENANLQTFVNAMKDTIGIAKDPNVNRDALRDVQMETVPPRKLVNATKVIGCIIPTFAFLIVKLNVLTVSA